MDSDKLALPVGTTLDRFIKRQQDDFPYATGELSQLLRDIALAGKIIYREISKSGLLDIEGEVGSENVQGEQQKKLDIIANIRFTRALKNGGQVCALISEENEDVVNMESKEAKYIVAIDPLDGSSNIDVNVSIGTIFSVYRKDSNVKGQLTKEHVLQKGRKQVAAGYLLYGSSFMFLYTTGKNVNAFTYEHSLGEYFLSHQNIRIPEDGRIYSMNDGGWNSVDENVRAYIQHCRDNKYTARYTGSLITDFHRNMFKGGIYMYPRTGDNPNGKLRLIYECNALAFIVENAGGMASNGEKNILDIQPESLHQREPLFIGSKNMVEDVTNPGSY